MPNNILGIVVFIVGLFLAFFAVIWAIDLSYRGQLAENSMALFILLIIALICIFYGKKEITS